LTNFVNSNKDEWKNNWEELYFPINVHDNHWILILVDKPAKAVGRPSTILKIFTFKDKRIE
jgi:hypothetical protein